MMSFAVIMRTLSQFSFLGSRTQRVKWDLRLPYEPSQMMYYCDFPLYQQIQQKIDRDFNWDTIDIYGGFHSQITPYNKRVFLLVLKCGG